MKGLMMNSPLLISSILEHAARVFGDQEIVTRTVEGPIHRYTYAAARDRAKRLARALSALEIQHGDRVATIAWNGFRHFEIYYAVSGMGAVCHTINPRLHPSQIDYIINHAEDTYVVVDLSFIPLLEAVFAKLVTVKGVVVMTDREHMPETQLPNVLCYEELIDGQSGDYEWPTFDEDTASSLCYTSGTAGNPKGVLYSHRSTVLHSFALSLPGVLGLAETETVLPVVPMFHANVWGIAYAGPMTGVKLVMPGPALDGKSLTELMVQERVTIAAGVPTIWLGLLAHLQESGATIPSLRLVAVGGAAAPRSMIEGFQEGLGIQFLHAWGMTEMSPLGTACVLKPSMEDRPKDDRYRVQCKQGRPVFGVEIKIVDDENRRLPHDGEAFGMLKVRGLWVASGYYRLEESESHDDDGWFSTGDVATIDELGYMNITDRAKDLIKSGGEWISSIDLENTAMSHPDVAQAAVIGIPHEKWTERPLLIVVPAPDTTPSGESILAHLGERVAKWWIPDDVVLVEELPIGPTGKVLKRKLREQYANYKPATS